MESLPAIKQNKAVATKDEQRQYVSFWLGEELLGVDIVTVKEVTVMMEITPVYHAPPEVSGYVNLRGEIHLVLDLRVLLGMPRRENFEDAMIVIFKNSVGEPFGILVDKIGDVITVQMQEVDAQTNMEGANQSKLSAGVYKLKEGLLVMLNAHDFLEAAKKGAN